MDKWTRNGRLAEMKKSEPRMGRRNGFVGGKREKRRKRRRGGNLKSKSLSRSSSESFHQFDDFFTLRNFSFLLFTICLLLLLPIPVFLEIYLLFPHFYFVQIVTFFN